MSTDIHISAFPQSKLSSPYHYPLEQNSLEPGSRSDSGYRGILTVFTRSCQEPILSLIKPVHTLRPYLFTIYFNITLLLCIGPPPPSGLVPSRFLTRILYDFLIYPMRATCPSHPPCRNRQFTGRTSLADEEYSMNSTNYEVLHCESFSASLSSSSLSLSGPNTILRTLF